MDEVDSIGSARIESGSGGGGGDSEVQRTMLELLNQLDGFEATNKIKVSPVISAPPACTHVFCGASAHAHLHSCMHTGASTRCCRPLQMACGRTDSFSAGLCASQSVSFKPGNAWLSFVSHGCARRGRC